jgi:hypothetical protein
MLPLQQQGSSHGSDTQTTEHTDGRSTLIRAPFKPIMYARLAAKPLGNGGSYNESEMGEKITK